MIRFNEEQQVFHLSNGHISYLLQIEEGGELAHVYFGKKIKQYSAGYRYPRFERPFSPNPPGSKDRLFSLDTLMMEYPGNGFGDFREAAYQLRHADGSDISHFVYTDYQIVNGKPKLAGLPQTYASADQAETLIIILTDHVAALELHLFYSLFADQPVISRSVKLINNSHNTVAINQLASLALDFPHRSLELIHLHGSWASERQITREKINPGIKTLDSKRGASSHQQNPFVAIVDAQANEFSGECYGFNLLYSGNHATTIEKDPFQQTRIISGINPCHFCWSLSAGDAFQTPEAVMVYSDQGLNKMSHAFHYLINNHLIRGKYKNKARPVLINNWEATYFAFNEQKLKNIVAEAKDIGVELFVLDDGWFGKREDDSSSLGDWLENNGKLACGLPAFVQHVHQQGLLFGLWLEPEMVSKNSELYRNHADWLLQTPGRQLSPARNQYVLDFSREEVRDAIFCQLSRVFDQLSVDYVKYDMNRNMTEVYSLLLDPAQQGEVFHRYMLGVYAFLERLVTAYPDVLFESCSGGGGRFDAGMLYYMPQTWTSDNTDAVARLKIQYGTSLAYPPSSMGAHVSASPNHQTGRITRLSIREHVAMSGLFGYELDLSTLTAAEKRQTKAQLAFYKQHRDLLQYGHFFRLHSPFTENDVAWMFVSQDKKEALVFYFRVLAAAAYPLVTLKLAGLHADFIYEVNKIVASETENNATEANTINHPPAEKRQPAKYIAGDELMQMGFYLAADLSGDYVSQLFHLRAQPASN